MFASFEMIYSKLGSLPRRIASSMLVLRRIVSDVLVYMVALRRGVSYTIDLLKAVGKATKLNGVASESPHSQASRESKSCVRASGEGELAELLQSLEQAFVAEPFVLTLHAKKEDQSSRTEDATEPRKRKAREEGEVFLSQELPQGLLVIIVTSAIAVSATFYYKSMSEYLAAFVENRGGILLDINTFPDILKGSAFFFTSLFLPIGLIAMVTVILATMLQTKFLISPKSLRPNPKKLLPSFSNLLERTVFSRTQVINAIKVLIKFTASTVIIVLFFRLRFNDFLEIFNLDLYDAFRQSIIYTYEIVLLLGAFVLVLAIPDWFVQRLEYLRRLKMTKEEVKRESKDLEGDPIIRQRQKERAREIATRTMLKNVPEADVIITNPTHFACALQYASAEMDAPKLIAKGADAMAMRIREIALEKDIPIVENKPFARALYHKVEINASIPKEFYTIAAEIFSSLDQYKN